ncbi:META domain-containing protein [Alteromonas abrolhosensis]|uniref:META domain-containing protein n=1 Tax=Alteromonas abrolhosensis TaxID=1892904 RepID=UPI003BACC4D9
MTYRKYLWALTSSALLSLTACSSVSSLYSDESERHGAKSSEEQTESKQLTLAASHWQVESIDQAGVIDFSHVTVNVNSNGDTSRVSGSTGCNQFTAALRAGDAEKVFSDKSATASFSTNNIILTKKACAPALMKQEQRFIDMLTASTKYSIVDNTWLVLYDSNGSETIKAITAQVSQSTSNNQANTISSELASSLSDLASSQKQDFVSSKEQGSSKTYKCETPNANIATLRVNTLGPETLALSLNNTHHIVQLSRSASGAKYTNNKNVVFWNKGDVATLSINSGYYHCSVNS